MNLSVVIPAHGRVELLISCLRSLNVDVQGDHDCTVCVVDDGSSIDEGYVRDSVHATFTLIWRAFRSNRGRSAARNEGVKATTGDIVVFLDSDMEAQRGFLDTHLHWHENHPHTAAIGAIIWPKGGGFLRYIGSRGVHKLACGDPAPPWYFVTGNASIRRSDLSGEQPFDEGLGGWGGEDQDLGMRLHAAGIRFAHVPDAETYHHFEGTLDEHIRRTALYGKNSLPELVRRYPALRKAVRLDILDTAAGRIGVSGPVYSTLYSFARLADRMPLPAKLYDYLTFAAYARGWLDGVRP